LGVVSESLNVGGYRRVFVGSEGLGVLVWVMVREREMAMSDLMTFWVVDADEVFVGSVSELRSPLNDC
jgi:hypothetical protein